MGSPRMIDANIPREKLCKWLDSVYVSTAGGQFDDGVGEIIADCIFELDRAPTLNPEKLPIVKDLQEKLKRYEQAEREGRLIVSPVAIGQKVYHLFFFKDGTGSHINEETVVGLHLRDDENNRCTKCGEYMVTRVNGYSNHIRLKEIGKCVFLSREAAEAVLKESKAAK